MPIQPQTRLFTAEELSNWLGFQVTPAKALLAERVAWGWIKPILKLEVRPDPVPDEMFAWLLELGAIAHENPSGLSAKAFGNVSEQYSSERRDELLRWVADGGETPPGSALKPQGNFPDPEPFPDRARRFSPGWSGW